jgi:ubiquinone/menaquinone biosynthesis C-methylase UbiE
LTFELSFSIIQPKLTKTDAVMKIKLIWLLVSAVIVLVIISFTIMWKNKTAVSNAATGEWKYELFSDSEIQKFSRPQHREVFWVVWRWKNAGYKKVLDVGAGLGADSVLFAKNGFDVSAIDINKFSTDHLANIAKDQNLAIDAIVADAKKLPYTDGTFDAVFANQVVGLSGCENAKKIITELCRVLKSDGNIYFNINYDDKTEKSKYFEKNGSGGLEKEKTEDVEYCKLNKKTMMEILKPLNVIFVYKEVLVAPDGLEEANGWYHVIASCKK